MRLGVCWEPLELTAVALQQSGRCANKAVQGSYGEAGKLRAWKTQCWHLPQLCGGKWGGVMP